MDKKILSRIMNKIQVPDLMNILVDRLSLPDLQSLLLEVYSRRVKKLNPAYISQQYLQNRFVQPAVSSPLKQLEFDRLAFSLLPVGFQTVELSPLCPLGTSSVIAPVDQNNIVTTNRNTEVCSDSTNVLALECARRRRSILAKTSGSLEKIKICASHRVVRAQTFNEPGAYAHFKLLALVTAGRDEGSFRFETDSILEHLKFYLVLLLESSSLELKIKDIRVHIIDLDKNIGDILEKTVLFPLRSKYPNIKIEFREAPPDVLDYYSKVRFQIFIRNSAETDFLIVDGGFTDWTQKLLSNRKERLLCSGLGSERFLTCFADE
jgi:hypothetical protein